MPSFRRNAAARRSYDGMHYGHGPDDWTLPDGPARDVGSTHVALIAKLCRLMYSS